MASTDGEDEVSLTKSEWSNGSVRRNKRSKITSNGELESSSSSPSDSDFDDTVIPTTPAPAYKTPNRPTNSESQRNGASKAVLRNARKKNDDFPEIFPVEMLTPKALQSTPKARESYRAGCRSLGLDDDVEGSARDKATMEEKENARGRGSPDPADGAHGSTHNGAPGSTHGGAPGSTYGGARSVSTMKGDYLGRTEDSVSMALDLQEAEEEVRDEYCAEREERESFLREYGIAMPPPVQTFRQRYQQNKTEERFVLESLHLENFKSYANKVHVGAFNPKFTCIIGPNGSGKSNTIDALLFVFGYNNKRIRASKTSELIHKSDAFPNFKHCRVTVTFKKIIPGADHYSYREVPGSKYSVAREADEKGRSFFLLNGKEVDRHALRARLMKDGIDLDQNRFLILQGEVEQIAMMKPKGKKEDDEEMLEYVEEIVGTHQYKKPIAQLNLLVEQLAKEEELQNLKVHEFGKQMNSMEAVKNETERFLKTENKVITRNHVIVQVHRAEVNLKREIAFKKLETSQEELNVKETDLKSLLKDRKSLEEEHENKKKYIREMEKGDSIEEKKISSAEIQKNQLQTKKKTLEELLPKLETMKEKLKNQLKSKEDAPERLKGEIKGLEETLEDVKKNLEMFERKVKEKVDGLPSLFGDRHSQIAALDANLAQVRIPLMAKRKELDDKEVEYKGFRGKYLRALEHQEELEERRHQLTAESDVLTEEIEKLSGEIPIKEKELLEIEPKKEELKKTVENLIFQISKIRDEIFVAAAVSKIQTNDRVLRSLLEAQRDGHLEGVIGRLGDLGTIDSKYDVGISTNFGNRFDNIVVKNVSASKNVLEHLRLHNLGRVNLLVLDKLTDCVRHTINRPFTAPANSARFIDLITPIDATYLPVFFYVLRDTLVTDTVDSAAHIAYGKQRHRVVSLDGKQVDGVSGSMSGGGDPQRGKMLTKGEGSVPPRGPYTGPPIASLEAQLADKEGRVGGAKTTLSFLEIQISELKKIIEKKKTVLEMNRTKLNDWRAELERLRGDCQKQMEVVKGAVPDEKRQKLFEEEMNVLKNELKTDTQNAEKIQSDIDELNEEIVAITKEEVEEWRIKEKKTKINLTKMEKELFAKKNELENHSSIVKKLEKEIEKKTKEISEKQTELETLNAELNAVEQEWTTARDDLKEKKDKLKADKVEEKRMMENVSVFDKKIENLEIETSKIRNFVQKTKTETEICLKQLAHFEKQLGAFKLNDIHSGGSAELKLLTSEELKTISIKEIEVEISQFQILMNTMQPKLNVYAEYFKLSDSRHDVMKAVEDVRRKRKLAFSFFMEFKNRRFSEFLEALRIIQTVLKTTYRQLTLGGDASLEPLDRFDPFSEGLEFMVKPKTKSWKNISYLSGGEKTISSLALIFALHYFKPTPFYIMDEIDAALDFRNTSVIAFFVKERALAAQFIIVSLRNQMFETAYRLIGICKPDHQSMAMFIDPEKFVLEETISERRETATTMGRQTGSLFSQATQGPLHPDDQDDTA